MSSKATITSVASSTDSVSLIAANPDRTGLIISNASTAILYVRIGGGTATATTSGHSFQLPTLANSNTILSQMGGRAWKGAVSGIWASANGSAQITEME